MIRLESTMNKYLQVLIAGIKSFYMNDAEALFSGKPVDERAMVGCIYRYIWDEIGRAGVECDIDIEYDRMNGKNGELVRKSIDLSQECGTITCRERCLALIARKAGKKKRWHQMVYSLRPDIIMHKRNSSPGTDNFLVAEFKKIPVSRTDDEFDRAKIRWNTCECSCLKYEIGVFVQLSKDFAKIEQCSKYGEFSVVEVVRRKVLI